MMKKDESAKTSVINFFSEKRYISYSAYGGKR